MDKKTLIGLVLIAATLIGFSLFNRQGADENASADNDKDSTKQEIVADSNATELPNSLIAQFDDNGDPIIDSVKGQLFLDTLTGEDTFLLIQPVLNDTTKQTIVENIDTNSVPEETYTLENEVLILEVTNRGGYIKNVFLKDYLSYEDYAAGNKNPLHLYDEISTYGLIYPEGANTVRTDQLAFAVVDQDDKSITLESNRNGKVVGFTYKMKPNKYDLDFDIYFEGFTDKEVASAQFTSDMYLLNNEKYYPNEKRQATLYWQYKDDDYDYIQNTESEDMEEVVDWVSFRSTFFTAIVSAKNGFGKKDSKVTLYAIEDQEQTTYVKQYGADLNLGTTKADNVVELNWYFGPADYDILVEYDNGTEDIVELGTGLFRWINKGAIRPLFMWLLDTGMGVGLAILILTIIVKLVLSPVNYKMYKSSAMMKVLKPEIEKITKKYPKKEDAMKKQQETMALYRETGVSPLAGCVPMLIQMPILFAIFRLFPSAIELRQTSFLWAEDLSTYDSPVTFGFSIPLYGDHMSIFTLLMAITTLLYTHYNSSNMQQPTQEGMPNMKFIMYFFPIMMIFFFNSYAAGLSYYYFISTLMTVLIMFAIKRFMIDDEKILAKIEENRANPKKSKGKSRFQQRLEDAQKLQQERAKNKKK
ncbi:membrane protein insertase YidC [Paracrocinitomix mangrovi]|uniref:membrane protein insertase YidC n=1 Tax=Paracrocinitomix mangrovi TaxID=2862509 RepID=UPI001C8D95AA|nr:membrane protein insertase YidC [Paracrocinitomix mangrovi]UKN01656.1 membrane protein insertase YidC [Paracrocinitomix mangrovi]